MWKILIKKVPTSASSVELRWKCKILTSSSRFSAGLFEKVFCFTKHMSHEHLPSIPQFPKNYIRQLANCLVFRGSSAKGIPLEEKICPKDSFSRRDPFGRRNRRFLFFRDSTSFIPSQTLPGLAQSLNLPLLHSFLASYLPCIL